MRGVALVLVAGVLALTGCGGGDGGGGSGSGGSTTATTAAPSGASGPAATVKAFYEAAARGDTAAACGLLAPKADPVNTTASLLLAGTGSAKVFAPASDCKATLDAFSKSQPSLLQQALPKIRTAATTVSGKLIIFRTDGSFKYHATLVQVGGQWRILEVVV
jgi:hypothetical protein